MIIRSFSRDQLATKAAEALSAVAAKAIQERGHFNLVLTGGGLGIELVSALKAQSIEWRKTSVIFSDERFVSLDNPDRNEFQAFAAWDGLRVSDFIRYPDLAENLEDAAEEMSSSLERKLGSLSNSSPVFDLVVLGIGPDGHVASLFPGRKHPENWVVAEADSPKPPAKRLSLSYTALNRSRRIWFLAAGAEKADAVRNAMKSDDLPAGRVRGQQETVWWLDQVLSDAL